jgi:hypothetical protein
MSQPVRFAVTPQQPSNMLAYDQERRKKRMMGLLSKGLSNAACLRSKKVL